jgi:hypothetical protein
LLRHLRKHWDKAEDALFRGDGAFFALKTILSDMVRDRSCPPTFLTVDALDECRHQQDEISTLIATSSEAFGEKVKCLVTSRNENPVKDALEGLSQETVVSLELNAGNIKAAVALYIDLKVDELSRKKKYHRQNNLEQEVKDYLNANAQACQQSTMPFNYWLIG